MNILFVSCLLPYPTVAHGGGSDLFHLIASLGERGHAVHLVSLAPYPGDVARADEMRPYCRSLAVVVPALTWGQKWRNLRRGLRADPLRLGRRARWEVRAHIRRVVAEHAVDIVQFEWTETGPYVDAVPPGVVTVLDEVDVSFRLLERTARTPWARWRAARARRGELALCRRFDVVLTRSAHDREVLRRALRGDTTSLSRSKFCARSGRKSASRPPDCHPAGANLDLLSLPLPPGHSPAAPGVDCGPRRAKENPYGIELTCSGPRLGGQTDAPRTGLRAKENPHSIEALQPWTHVDRFRDVRPDERQPGTVLFVGAMDRDENCQAVLWFYRRCWPLVRAGAPEARLEIVGASPPAGVRRLARDPAVTVTGYVPDLREPYAGSHVCVAPMLRGGGVMNKVVDAMAAGRPVVSTVAGNEGVDAPPGQAVLVADEPEAFARQVAALLRDEPLWARIAQGGRAHVQRVYDWERNVSQLEALYRRSVERRAGSVA